MTSCTSDETRDVCQQIMPPFFFVFKVTETLTFERMTSKSIGVTYWSCPTSVPSFRTIGPSIIQLSIGQALVKRRTEATNSLFLEGGHNYIKELGPVTSVLHETCVIIE